MVFWDIILRSEVQDWEMKDLLAIIGVGYMIIEVWGWRIFFEVAPFCHVALIR